MNVFAQGSRWVLQLRSGESLLEALCSFDGPGALLVEGSGALTDIEIEDAGGEVRKLGAAEALSLSGLVTTSGAELQGTFLRGAQVLGGRVVGARVVRCMLRAERYDEVAAAEHFSSDSLPSGSLPSGSFREESEWGVRAPKPATPAPAAKSSGGWADAIAASEEATVEAAQQRFRPRRSASPPPRPGSPLDGPQKIRSAKDRAKMPSFLEEPMPEIGDYVEHKQFGICRVQRVNDDGGLLIRLPKGGTKKIKLTVLEVLPPREDTDRVIFPLRPRGAG